MLTPTWSAVKQVCFLGIPRFVVFEVSFATYSMTRPARHGIDLPKHVVGLWALYNTFFDLKRLCNSDAATPGVVCRRGYPRQIAWANAVNPGYWYCHWIYTFLERITKKLNIKDGPCSFGLWFMQGFCLSGRLFNSSTNGWCVTFLWVLRARQR